MGDAQKFTHNYRDCSMAGTYRIPCRIISSRLWTEDDMTFIERQFGFVWTQKPERMFVVETKDGRTIECADTYVEEL